MKKLLVGLTLLASVSSFAVNASYNDPLIEIENYEGCIMKESLDFNNFVKSKYTNYVKAVVRHYNVKGNVDISQLPKLGDKTKGKLCANFNKGENVTYFYGCEDVQVDHEGNFEIRKVKLNGRILENQDTNSLYNVEVNYTFNIAGVTYDAKECSVSNILREPTQWSGQYVNKFDYSIYDMNIKF